MASHSAAQEQAAEWLVLLSEDESQHTKEAFDRWLEAEPAHRQAYAELASTWDMMSEAASNAEGQAWYEEAMALDDDAFDDMAEPAVPIAAKTSNASAVSSFLAGLAAFVDTLLKPAPIMATLVLGIVVVLYSQLPTGESFETAQFSTSHGEMKTFTLADGSTVTLGPKSTLSTRFNESSRQATLVSGEAFFDVTSNPQRAFTVVSDDVKVTVVGTQFDVQKRPNSVSVSVIEGRVHVDDVDSTVPMADAEVVLTAGESAFRQRGGDIIESIDTSDGTAWREGRLVYIDQALLDIVADANRYSSKEFVLAEPSIGKTRVTLSLQAEHIDSLPDLLSHLLPIKYSEFEENTVLISSL